jgi:hypothetical protein
MAETGIKPGGCLETPVQTVDNLMRNTYLHAAIPADQMVMNMGSVFVHQVAVRLK